MAEMRGGDGEPRLIAGFYRLEFEVRGRYRYDAVAGSAWRGVLGHELRARHCRSGSGACECTPPCDYARLFEPPLPDDTHGLPLAGLDRLPSPWLFHSLPEGPVPAGGSLYLGLTLLGSANADLPRYVDAIAAATRRLEMADELILTAVSRWHRVGGWRVIEHEQPQPAGPIGGKVLAPEMLETGVGSLRVSLESPLRLRVGGRHQGQKSLDPSAFCMAVIRRMSLLAAVYGPGPVAADFRALKTACGQVSLGRHELAWQDQARRSNRQGRRHPLGGVTGWFELQRLPGALLPWLSLGQAAHVGKAVSMGLGRYRLESASTGQAL